MTTRSAASNACRDTGCSSTSTTRSNNALSAALRSPVKVWSDPTARAPTAVNPGARQTVPWARRIWPSVREASNRGPSIRGALQSVRVRAQSQTQAAFGFAGSRSLAFHSCQPHEKTDPSPSSAETSFAESASHFTTWNQAEVGWRALRPPMPFSLRKLSMMPSRFAGIPIEVSGVIAARKLCRSSRLPRIGPSGQTFVAGRYTSRTMSATLATEIHQATASLLAR